MESESKIIIQILKNVKSIIEISKGRDYWESWELPNINITYNNVCEIAKQLENPPKIEELPEDLNDLGELPDDLKKSEELPESIELKLNN